MRSRKLKSTLPKHLYKDAVKWVLFPAKIMLDSVASWPQAQNCFNLTLNLCIFFNFILLIIGEVIYAMKYASDFTKVISILAIGMVVIEALARQIILFLKRKEISQILTEVYFEFLSSSAGGEELENNLARKSWYIVAFCLFYTCAAFFSGSQYVMLPLIIGNREMPLLTDYSFNWKRSPIYELLYVLQTVLCNLLVFGICAFDMLFIALLWNCVAQFQILGYYFQSEFEKITQRKSNPKRVLVKFIKHHQNLLKTCKKLEKVFRLFILSLLLGNIITVCVPSFLGGVLPLEGAKMIAFSMGHLCELLIYSFLGSNLIYESTALSDSIAHSNWYLYEDFTEVKKLLLMVIIRSQKEVNLTAGGFTVLSLTTCIKVLRVAFSLYTLLNTVLERKR